MRKTGTMRSRLDEVMTLLSGLCALGCLCEEKWGRPSENPIATRRGALKKTTRKEGAGGEGALARPYGSTSPRMRESCASPFPFLALCVPIGLSPC